jgi:hypothetical protein
LSQLDQWPSIRNQVVSAWIQSSYGLRVHFLSPPMSFLAGPVKMTDSRRAFLHSVQSERFLLVASYSLFNCPRQWSREAPCISSRESDVPSNLSKLRTITYNTTLAQSRVQTATEPW